MNSGELQQELALRVMRRESLLNDDPELLLLAINWSHLQMQRDANWRCMESGVLVNYPANSMDGAVVESAAGKADGKCIRFVKSKNTAGVFVPVIPATEDDVQRKLQTIYVTRGAATLGAGGFGPRWYEKQCKVVIVDAPTVATPLWVDYYRYLPDYAENTDHDYFSDFLNDVLLLGAAARGSSSLWQDERAGMFKAQYTEMLASAYAADVAIKNAGADELQPMQSKAKAAATAPATTGA